MHELSIAKNIIDLVTETIHAEELPHVEAVNVRLGEFSGVVKESLEFSFQAIAAGAGLGHAVLKLEEVPLTGTCRACRLTSRLEYGVFECPVCGSTEIEQKSGSELMVVSVELSQDASTLMEERI